MFHLNSRYIKGTYVPEHVFFLVSVLYYPNMRLSMGFEKNRTKVCFF